MFRNGLISLITILALSACGRSASTKADLTDSTSDTNDTVAPVKPLTVLPDTAFESAARISHKVDMRIPEVDGAVDIDTDFYDGKSGWLTFRGNLKRDADFGGRVSGTPSDIVIDWEFVTETDNRSTSVGTWGGGSGWTGQPLFVEWPGEKIKEFKASGVMNPDASAKEIMVGSLASNVYFIDFETGKPTRKPLSTGNPIKGTISLDPTLNGNLYVGHGVPASRPFGALTFNLNTHELIHTFGEDAGAQRRWGAYDSSPVRLGNFVFRPGENGTLYKWLVAPDGDMRLHSLMRYTVAGAAPGIESSMAVYRNYGYIADNHGYVVCVNLNTMKPVWSYFTGDDSDATPVIAEERDGVFVYVGSEIDRQSVGTARFAKLDALTGQPVWERRIEGRRENLDEKHFDGGFYATPLLGQGNAEGLIFANCVMNTDGRNGRLMAFDRQTGETRWETPLRYYAWSSPVGFLNEGDDMFILTGDCAGNLYIINALSGEIITRKAVGSNFESSPVVVGNSAVVGSRGNKIFKVSLK